MKTSLCILLIGALSIASGEPSTSAIDTLAHIPIEKQAHSLNRWKNPNLRLVDQRGIYINDSPHPVPIEHLLETLAALPRSAWPYGRVVALSAFPGLSGFPGSNKITARVTAILESANINIVSGLSA